MHTPHATHLFNPNKRSASRRQASSAIHSDHELVQVRQGIAGKNHGDEAEKATQKVVGAVFKICHDVRMVG